MHGSTVPSSVLSRVQAKIAAKGVIELRSEEISLHMTSKLPIFPLVTKRLALAILVVQAKVLPLHVLVRLEASEPTSDLTYVPDKGLVGHAMCYPATRASE